MKQIDIIEKYGALLAMIKKNNENTRITRVRKKKSTSNVEPPRIFKAEAQFDNLEHHLTAPCSGTMRLRLQFAKLAKKKHTITAYCYDRHYTLMGKDETKICAKGNYVLRRNFEFNTYKPWRMEDYTVVVCVNAVPFSTVVMHVNGDSSTTCYLEDITEDEPLYWMVSTFENEPYAHRWNTAREFGGLLEMKMCLAALHREWNRFEEQETVRPTEVMIIEGDSHFHAGRVALAHNEILKTGKDYCCSINCDTEDETEAEEKLVRDNVSNDLLIFYHAGCLVQPRFASFMKQLIKQICNKNRGTLFVFCDSTGELRKLFREYPLLESLIDKELYLKVEPLDATEVTNLLLRKINEKGLLPSQKPTEMVEYRLEEAIAANMKDYSLQFWTDSEMQRYINFIADNIFRGLGFVPDGEEPIIIEEKHLPDLQMFLEENTPEHISSKMYLRKMRAEFEEVTKELNAMVGLHDLKEGLELVLQKMMFNKLRSEQGLPVDKEASHHMIFTGNPGTGKTTVAKLIGKVYKMLGLLSCGNVIETDRKRLVGRYIGETEEKMVEVISTARGNVLFIDEAYSLFTGGEDRRDFGNHVIESLLPILAEPNPDMVVIMAGYEQEMDNLMNANQGLRSRFAYTWNFVDYTADELYEIARYELDRSCYKLEEKAADCLKQLCKKMVANKRKDFANARWVKQVVNNGILPAMAKRAMAQFIEDDLELLTIVHESDVIQAAEKYGPKEKNMRRIGFCA